MTQEEIVQKAQEEILSLLKGVDRLGMDKVIWYLNESTYFGLVVVLNIMVSLEALLSIPSAYTRK